MVICKAILAMACEVLSFSLLLGVKMVVSLFLLSLYILPCTVVALGGAKDIVAAKVI